MDDVRARLTAYRKSKKQDDTASKTQPSRPNILWAQRSDKILLTVSLNDIHDEQFSLEEKELHFSGLGGSGDGQYDIKIDFYKEIIPHKSKHRKTDRGLFFEIKKKESGPYWPRLISEPTNWPNISVDFSRWKDEDDESETEKSKSTPPISRKQLQASVQEADEVPAPSLSPRPWYITALYITLWLLVWGFFVEVEFGVVFIILSAFAFIVLSLRGSRRRIGELSAYSVFNENCEQIDGTLTAEQFEREMRYGPTAVR